MRIKDGFVLRKMQKDYIVVGEGLAQVNFNKLMVLNESAAYLWENIAGKEFTEEDLVRLLLERYDVTEELARTDAAKVAQLLQENGVLEE